MTPMEIAQVLDIGMRVHALRDTTPAGERDRVMAGVVAAVVGTVVQGCDDPERMQAVVVAVANSAVQKAKRV